MPLTDESPAPQGLQRLVQDRFALGLAATLLHIGQMGLVGLNAGGRRRVGLVLTGRQTTARAVPVLGNGQADLVGKRGPRLVTVAAPVRDVDGWGRVAALGLSRRTSTNSAPPDRVATSHEVAP